MICDYDDQPSDLLNDDTCYHLTLFRVVRQLIEAICLTCLLVSFAVSFEDSQYEVVPLTAEKVLEFIEQAYPNPITPEDLARYVRI